MARCFVAVWPPAVVLAELVAARRPSVDVRWLPPDRWHVTLRFLGQVDVAEAAACLDRASLPRATASVGRVARRLGRDAIVLDVAGVDAVAAAVRDATSDLVPDDGRRFVGHLTLARRAQRVPSSFRERLDGDDDLRFEVREVVLAVSRTLPSGAEYEIVRRWPVVTARPPAPA